jgi:uncharacterized protein DUF4145
MPRPFQGHRNVSRHEGGTNQSWFPFTCGHCGRDGSAAVLASMGPNGNMVRWLQCPTCGEGSVEADGVSSYLYPGVAPGPSLEGLPNEVEAAYEETRRCMSVNAYTACEGLCRKILMHVAVEKGAKEGDSFVSYVNHLEKSGYVTPPMKPWVDLIRQHGNEAQHLISPSDKTRAEATLMFTAELLRLTYEMDYMSKKYAPTSTAKP